jgi:hypothetical protein
LTQLEALDIANTQTTDNGLDSLMTLVNLKELLLGRRSESDREVELLRVPTLTYLDLSGPTGAERPDTTYRKLHQSGPMRTDLMRAIAEPKDLRVLRLGYSNVAAEGLKALSALKQVEQLALECCAKVNDEAASERLQPANALSPAAETKRPPNRRLLLPNSQNLVDGHVR